MAKAIGYLYQAGERAVRLFANEEAITHFSKALGLLELLPDTPERREQELDIQIALGPLLMITTSYAAPEVEKAYTRAAELCQQVGRTPQLFPVLWGLHQVYLFRAQLHRSAELGEQCLYLAQDLQDPDLLL